MHAGLQHRACCLLACSLRPRTELAVQVLCTRDMLQHCDVVLMLDNDSLLKQAAAKQLKSAASSPGAAAGGGSGTAGSVGMTLSDANKVLSLIFPLKTVPISRRQGCNASCGRPPLRLPRHAAERGQFLHPRHRHCRQPHRAVSRSTCSVCTDLPTPCAAGATRSCARITQQVQMCRGATSASAW